MKARAPLYAIYDVEFSREKGVSLQDFLTAFYAGGGRLLQYRNKIHPKNMIDEQINAIRDIIREYDTIEDPFHFIVNDYDDIALKHNLSFHQGQTDGLSAAAADFLTKRDNEMAPSSLFWGRSTHDEREIERVINEDPRADYIGFGPVFGTKTKEISGSAFHLIEMAASRWKNPIVWIGGITLEKVQQLPKSRRFFYAVISDFFRYGSKPRDIEKYTRNFIEIVKKM